MSSDGSLPCHLAGYQIASVTSAVCQYKTLSVACLELKFCFISPLVAFVENCWLSLLESDLDFGSA